MLSGALHSTEATRGDFTWALVNQADQATMALSRLPATLGRHPDADVCVPQPSVSSRHAEFSQHADELLVRDLGSTNGTFLNGQRISDPSRVAAGDLLQFGHVVFSAERRPQEQGAAVTGTICVSDAYDQAIALAQLDRLLAQRAVTLHYQPIVEAGTFQTVAYEVLARSRMYGLTTPAPMFQAAAVLHKEAELSQLLRSEAIGSDLHRPGPHLFFNTHPRELQDLKALIASLRELRRDRPHQPMTLEIHEAAVLDTTAIKVLRLALHDLDMRLAYDDFGAGQTRLHELIDTQPDYVKFDMRMVRGIHEGSIARWRMLSSLVALVRDLDVTPLAEGIECLEEAEVCRGIGFELFQGYYFGRPASARQFFGTPDRAP